MLIFVVLDSENEDENERRSTGMHFCIYHSTCLWFTSLSKVVTPSNKMKFFGKKAYNYLISQ